MSTGICQMVVPYKGVSWNLDEALHPVAFLEVYYGENCHTLKFCCYFIHRTCMVRFLSKASFKSLGSKHVLSFFLIVWFGEGWLPVSFSTIMYEFTQSVCSLTSSRIPSFTRDSISSLKAASRWIGTFLGACHAGLCPGLRWNLHGSPEKYPIPSKQPEYCDQMSCFINWSLFTEVLPLCWCLTFLKANNSPGLQTWIVELWTCAQCASGALCKVSWCTCTGLTCFVVIVSVIADAEDVVVLKEATGCAICVVCAIFVVCNVFDVLCIVFEWHWFWYCFSDTSCRIWKTFDDVPCDDVPSDVPFLLKLGTFSPFTMFSSG